MLVELYKYIPIIWALSGFVFWLDTLRINGLPDFWKSTDRIEGWDNYLIWYLPLSIILGPISWAIVLAAKMTER